MKSKTIAVGLLSILAITVLVEVARQVVRPAVLLAQAKGKKISDLTEDTAPTATAKIEIENGSGKSRYSTLPNSAKGILANISNGVLLYNNGGLFKGIDNTGFSAIGSVGPIPVMNMGATRLDFNSPTGSSANNPATINIKMLNNVQAIQITNEGDHNTAPSYVARQYFNSTSDLEGPALVLSRAGGTIATPTAVANNETLGNILFRGFTTSTADGRGGQIRVTSDGGASSGSCPGQMLLMTSPTGTTQPVVRQRIRADGVVVFNETALSTGDFTIQGDTDANLFVSDASADKVGIGTATPSAKLEVAGTFTATGAAVVSTVNTGFINAELDANVWTPTLTGVANVAASTPYECNYLRVGDFVTCSGKVDIDPTAGATPTQLGISLPVASDLTANEKCSGTANGGGLASLSAAVRGDATNNRAEILYVSLADVSNQSFYFHFTYKIQ